ncbi:MAG: N-acetyltransferase [Chitinophagaceae bacterium]|nr:MAG: N-acetyltransferase [Chitinophagaceae bacterium]
MNYLFKSQRLGFRNWTEQDIPLFSEINTDSAVMEFFPSTYSLAETNALVAKMQQQFATKAYCYFAVDLLESAQFIGFIGINDKDFEADFSPCVDIGWRLSTQAWGKGLATEGAKRCLEYAFENLEIEKIYSMAPAVNIPSENVMKKIGMVKVGTFQHPQLNDYPYLQECVLYQIKKE